MKTLKGFSDFMKMDLVEWGIKGIFRRSIMANKAVLKVVDPRNSSYITLHGADSKILEYLLERAVKHDPNVKFHLL